MGVWGYRRPSAIPTSLVAGVRTFGSRFLLRPGLWRRECVSLSPLCHVYPRGERGESGTHSPRQCNPIILIITIVIIAFCGIFGRAFRPFSKTPDLPQISM